MMRPQDYRRAVGSIRWSPAQRRMIEEKLRNTVPEISIQPPDDDDEPIRIPYIQMIYEEQEARMKKERKQARMYLLILAAALLTIGGTVMECDSMTVIHDGVSSILPQKEFMLLYKMAAYPGRIFTRQQLMDEIWGYDSESDTHTVDVHIGRLRDRFRDNKDFKIVTMRGVGYKVVKL